MSDPHIAFATGDGWRNLTPEDRLIAAHLGGYGFRVDAAVWDDPVDWRIFDAVVIRSCWDYHLRPAEFGAWLDRLDDLGCRVWNPTGLLRWNSRKTYLEDLQRRGIETVPTVFLSPGTSLDLEALRERLGSDELVVKPAVAASAYGAVRISRHPAGDELERVEALLEERELMAQPLLREVLTVGEWSLVLFAGELSHAVLKVPRAGDFRVQEELGGTSRARRPPPALAAVSRRVVERLDGETLYARVDLVEIDGRGVLMELELIEPWLYFEADPRSPERFRRALAARLAAHQAWP